MGDLAQVMFFISGGVILVGGLRDQRSFPGMMYGVGDSPLEMGQGAPELIHFSMSLMDCWESAPLGGISKSGWVFLMAWRSRLFLALKGTMAGSPLSPPFKSEAGSSTRSPLLILSPP